MLIHSDKDLNYNQEDKKVPKGIQKEIACFSWTTASGEIIPVLFKMQDEDGVLRTFNKIHVNLCEKKLYAGIPSYEFACTIIVNGLSVEVTLIYYPESCRWVLIEK